MHTGTPDILIVGVQWAVPRHAACKSARCGLHMWTSYMCAPN